MTMSNSALGIIAGGGELPRSIAECARAAGRDVFVLAIVGTTDAWANEYPCEWLSLGEPGRAIKALHAHNVGELTLAGRVQRPKFSEIKLDAKGVMAAPRVFAAALKGDDALLRSLVDMFQREGFRIVGAAEAAPDLIVREGVLGRVRPSDENKNDIAQALKIVHALGAFDVGQAAIVCEGLPLAVEAAEGTDAMISRIVALPEHFRGSAGKPRGVLVKAPKPIQDRKTDLPVVGIETVRNVAKAFLAGIAVEAGGALILDRAGVIAEADKHGVFLVGVAA
jgi:DUF1009 family protein